jgi:hypothetical protein
MLGERENQFSLTRAALSTGGAAKKQIPISNPLMCRLFSTSISSGFYVLLALHLVACSSSITSYTSSADGRFAVRLDSFSSSRHPLIVGNVQTNCTQLKGAVKNTLAKEITLPRFFTVAYQGTNVTDLYIITAEQVAAKDLVEMPSELRLAAKSECKFIAQQIKGIPIDDLTALRQGLGYTGAITLTYAGLKFEIVDPEFPKRK